MAYILLRYMIITLSIVPHFWMKIAASILQPRLSSRLVQCGSAHIWFIGSKLDTRVKRDYFNTGSNDG
jgi:hypothetical protein